MCNAEPYAAKELSMCEPALLKRPIECISVNLQRTGATVIRDIRCQNKCRRREAAVSRHARRPVPTTCHPPSTPLTVIPLYPGPETICRPYHGRRSSGHACSATPQTLNPKLRSPDDTWVGSEALLHALLGERDAAHLPPSAFQGWPSGSALKGYSLAAIKHRARLG